MTRRGVGDPARQARRSGAPDLLTTDEAAAYLTLTPARLKSWRAAGTGPPWLKLGQAVRYERADLDAYLIAQKVS